MYALLDDCNPGLRIGIFDRYSWNELRCMSSTRVIDRTHRP